MTSQLIFISLLGLVLGISGGARAGDVRTSTCSKGNSCEISGIASNQHPGHGMVSRIDTDDGRCLNISLPEDISDGLEQDGQVRMTVRGDVLGYPKADGAIEYLVDDRSVGIGECGNNFVFVESTSDACIGTDAQCRQGGLSGDQKRAHKPHKVRVVLQE